MKEKKKKLIIGLLSISVIASSFIAFTHAKYRVTESVELANGVINYEVGDANLVGVYINTDNGYEKTDTIPDSGYVLNEEESYCTVDKEKDTSINITYDTSSKTLAISPMTTKGTKCYLYFDEQLTAKDVILADNTTSSSRSGNITGTFSGTSHTLYTKQDDYGTSYFYAGNINNNWVHFAGYYWRIIRINGDGSIRMIYNGTSTSGTGTGTQIQTSEYNSNYNDNAYVGYMYGSTGASSYSGAHANTNNSTIKGILDNWYKTNIVDKKDSSGTSYNEYVSTEAGFCNDRKVVSGWSGCGTLGYGTNNTVYAPTKRFMSTSWSWLGSQTPTLNCSQSNDLFTASGSSKGNKKLIYPIGLITADEVILAGGFGGTGNSSYYLYTGQTYWTMSPYRFVGTGASVFYVDSDGSLGNRNVNGTRGIRPVINLSADVRLSGTGTSTNPYVIL